MNRQFLFFSCSILASLLFSTCALAGTHAASNQNNTVNAEFAGEAQFKLNRMVAPIHSRDDLVDHLAMAAHDGSPLDQLSAEGKATFLSSLKFGDQGLGSFNSAVLERELTPTQAYAVLALFGFQDAIATLDFQHQGNTKLDAFLRAQPCPASRMSNPCDND